MPKKKTKSSKKESFFSKPLGKAIIIAVPVLIIIALVLIFLIPHYSLSVTDAEIESSNIENGVKQITARIKFDCNAKVTDGEIICENATINGEFSSNKDVTVKLPEDVNNQNISDGTFSFDRQPVKTKQVIIRPEPITENNIKEYTITMQNSKGVDVIDYKLIVETVYSEADLSLLNKIPNAEEVAAGLSTIDTVDGYCIVTEDNDPNGNLNKTGGYIAAVYFSDNRANLESKNNPYSDYKDICDQGTVAGGQIEVYANTEDAEKRLKYLDLYKGSILSSGDNYLYGTSIIRISNEMTATQMAELKDKVVKALTE